MNIYNLDRVSIKDMIKNFGSSTYGKTIFFISFFVPIITGIFSVLVFISYLTAPSAIHAYYFSRYLLITVIITIITLLSGCRYYYKEFRIYVESLGKK